MRHTHTDSTVAYYMISSTELTMAENASAGTVVISTTAKADPHP